MQCRSFSQHHACTQLYTGILYQFRPQISLPVSLGNISQQKLTIYWYIHNSGKIFMVAKFDSALCISFLYLWQKIKPAIIFILYTVTLNNLMCLTHFMTSTVEELWN